MTHDRCRMERHVCQRQESAAAHYRVARDAYARGQHGLAATVQQYAAERSARARSLAEAIR